MIADDIFKTETFTFVGGGNTNGAIKKILLHGTTATNTVLKAEQGFDEHLTQRALYGSSVHARQSR